MCLCVCGANERVFIDTLPAATGQRVITHRHAYGHGTQILTLISSTTSIYSLFHTINPIFFILLTIPALTHSSNIQATSCIRREHRATLSSVHPFIQCRASIRCTSDKPICFSFLSVHLYAALRQNKQHCKADSISVSPCSSLYQRHELWIGVSTRVRSHCSAQGHTLGASSADVTHCNGSFSSFPVFAL